MRTLTFALSALLTAQAVCAQPKPTPAPLATAESVAPAPAAAPAPCDNAPLKFNDLLGQWQVQWPNDLAGEPGHARLVFASNPEFADSLLGLLDVGSKRHELAGDLEEDLLTLEESSDGKSISANWSLRATPERCGKELTGTRVRASDGQQRAVVLRRAAKW